MPVPKHINKVTTQISSLKWVLIILFHKHWKKDKQILAGIKMHQICIMNDEMTPWQELEILSPSPLIIKNLFTMESSIISSVLSLIRVWPLVTHEPQHARSPCPSPTPGVYPNSCPLSRWCHPAISSSVIPFFSCPQSLPESGSFPMSQLFAWGGQSIGVSASASVLPTNTQDWSPLGWTGWMISLQSKGLSRIFFSTTVQKLQFFGAHLSSQSNSHIHTWPQEKP